MHEDLIIRRPDGVVAIVGDTLYYVRPPGSKKESRNQREKIIKQMKSNGEFPPGFPAATDFVSKLSSVAKVEVHGDGRCDIHAESSQAIRFFDRGQACKFVENITATGTWSTSQASSGMKWRIDAAPVLVAGFGLAVIAMFLHQGDWDNFDVSDVSGLRTSRKMAARGLAKAFVDTFGQNAFLWASIGLAIITAALALRACSPRVLTVFSRES